MKCFNPRNPNPVSSSHINWTVWDPCGLRNGNWVWLVGAKGITNLHRRIMSDSQMPNLSSTLSSDHFHQCRTCQRPCDNHPRPQPVQYKKAGKLWLFFQHLLTKWDSPPSHPPITGQKIGNNLNRELMSSRKPRSDLEAQLLGQSSSSVIFLFHRSKNCKNVNTNLRTLSRGEWKQDYIQMERENEALIMQFLRHRMAWPQSEQGHWKTC